MEMITRTDLIGFNSKGLEKAVCRFISFERLADILLNRQITLVNINKWEDPYENILSKCVFTGYNSKEIKIGELQNRIFGQCWTLTDESDAFWRIYSNDKKGVKIKTTLQKLFDATFNFSKSSLGKVKYLSQSDIDIKIY